jgi:predicted RNA-binding protein with PUA-like domain
MNYWLVKSEPDAYSWDRFLKEGKVDWDGVRNYQARNNLKEMKKGDQVLFYHSVSSREVVGIAEVAREHFPDPTTKGDRWVAVELVPVKALKKSVNLTLIKQDERLENIALIKQSRLSVMPLKDFEFDAIVALGS